MVKAVGAGVEPEKKSSVPPIRRVGEAPPEVSFAAASNGDKK